MFKAAQDQPGGQPHDSQESAHAGGDGGAERPGKQPYDARRNSHQGGEHQQAGADDAGGELLCDGLGGIIHKVPSGLADHLRLVQIQHQLIIQNHGLTVPVQLPVEEILSQPVGNALHNGLAFFVIVCFGADDQVKPLGHLLLSALIDGKLLQPFRQLRSAVFQPCLPGGVACIALVQLLFCLGKFPVILIQNRL